MWYREDNDGYITNSKLNDFKTCPYFYKIKWVDNIVPEEDSDALVVWAAFDLYMRNKKEFDKSYTIVARRGWVTNTIELTQKQGTTIRQCEFEFKRQPLYNPKWKIQYEIETLYKGHKVKGTLDEFQEKEKLIIDDKTTASLDTFKKWANKYKMQMAFYQWLLEVKDGIVWTSALLRVVTKEDVSRSGFFYIPAQTLLANRDFVLQALDDMIQAIESNRFPYTQDKRNCLECPAWNICPNTIQTEADIEIL